MPAQRVDKWEQKFQSWKAEKARKAEDVNRAEEIKKKGELEKSLKKIESDSEGFARIESMMESKKPADKKAVVLVVLIVLVLLIVFVFLNYARIKGLFN